MVIYTSQNFWKSVPREKMVLVRRLLLKTLAELSESPEGFSGISLAYQTKKFLGGGNFLKFKVTDGDRIIFTFSDNIINKRASDKPGIYLHRYVSHDEQSRVATAMARKDQKTFREFTGFLNPDIVEPMDPADKKVFADYTIPIDLEKVVTFLIDSETSIDRDDLVQNARIDNQQLDYVNDQSPMLIIGGAGSGKTLVSIHKVRAYSDESDLVAYFTLSEKLRENSERIYMNLQPKHDNAEFYSISDFCIDYLHKDFRNYMTHDRFDREFYKRHGQDGFHSFDIWAEIRGIIKGYMGRRWFRPRIFDFNEYDGYAIQYLKDHGWVGAIDDTNRRLTCLLKNEQDYHEAQKEILKQQDSKNNNTLEKTLRSIYEMHSLFRYTQVEEKILNLAAYQELKLQASVYNSAQREMIHRIAVQYQNWLNEHGYFDDNDLAAGVIMKSGIEDNHADSLFDYIVIDEVQDLTELQIYMLTQLVPSLSCVTFTGDIHQIINPTYFQNKRLGEYYYLNGYQLEERLLNKNYRSQKSIVQLANDLSKIRRKLIAKEKATTEQLEVAIADGNQPFYLSNTEENLLSALQTLSERANACIIVANDDSKQKVSQMLGGDPVNLFTIQEIKGLEFEYVFCYNLVTSYQEGWDEIFAEKAKKSSKHRFYFNVFYVAITRATENLCVFEQCDLLRKKEDIFVNFFDVECFDEEALAISGNTSSPDEWLYQAQQMERSGHYERARRYYEKANDRGSADRCHALLEFDAGNHDYAIEMLLELEEYAHSYRLASRVNKMEHAVISLILLEKQDYLAIDKKYGEKKVATVISQYSQIESLWRKIYKNYLEEKLYAIEENIKSANAELERLVQ